MLNEFKDSEARIKILTIQLADEKDALRKVNIQSGLSSARLVLQSSDLGLAVARDQILQHLGKDWTVSKVLKEIGEFKRLQAELFEKSELE